MAKTSFRSVPEYIASRPVPVQAALKQVRGILRRALPKASEVISYQIPAYKLDGRVVIYFAGWKEHYSLYPSSDYLMSVLRDKLGRYEVSKGTIRFPLSAPVPAALIARVAKLRATEVAERAKANAGPKTRVR